MLLSSSTIIVKIDNKILKKRDLSDFHFFQENPTSHNKKFYSINFQQNGFGEIHWSNSFEHGEMNIIGFCLKNNNFYLFTSSVQHHVFLKIILSEFYGEPITVSILKLPFPIPTDIELKIDNFECVLLDKNIGVFGQVIFNDSKKMLKLYSNGVINYSLTDNIVDLNKLLEITTKILNTFGVSVND